MSTDTQKSTFNKVRDALQQGIYCIINPLVRLMIKIGITPNIVTTIGLLGNIAAAAVIAWAAVDASTSGYGYTRVMWGGILIIAFSLFDMLDGQVARLGGMSSVFGAFYDSVLDRYCEMFTVGAVAFWFIETGHPWAALVSFVALVGSVMVSYARARAEGLGLDCKVGFMQRPERVVVTALGAIITGACHTPWVLAAAMGVIALFANLTAFARIAHVHSLLRK